MSGAVVKVGLIGIGKMGQLHLEKFLKVPAASVLGFYEPYDKKARTIEETYRVPRFSNIETLLFESDAVVVASPTPSHFALARKALEAGVHVLIEKPIAETADQTRELLLLAERQGLILQPGFIERFRFMQLCRGISISPVQFIESHRLTPSLGRETTVDVLNDIMIHDLDLVMSLIPEDPISVSAVGVAVITDRCDLANVRMEFGNGAVANLTASRVSKKYLRKFRLFSPSLYASLDFMENRAEILTRNENAVIESSQVEATGVDPLMEQAMAFVGSVRSGEPPVVPPADGFRALRLIEEVRQQIRARQLTRPKGQTEFSFQDLI